ncbi:MAG: hypothetical protein WC979_01445 [Candidatus Pacearchaeota archaeon]|jgi:hypothetical protein|nr:hypothetical protein [Clostridia bacterium]
MKRKILSIDEYVQKEKMFESEVSELELLEEAESLKDQYKKHWHSTLDSFGVSHMSQLHHTKRSEFFAKIKEGWVKGVGPKNAANTIDEEDETIDDNKYLAAIAKKKETADKLQAMQKALEEEALKQKTPADLQKELDELDKQIKKYKGPLSLRESAILEADIKTDEEFKSWAEEKLKKMHGDKYDQAKADETITGLLKKKSDDDLDYGSIIGMLNK